MSRRKSFITASRLEEDHDYGLRFELEYLMLLKKKNEQKGGGRGEYELTLATGLNNDHIQRLRRQTTTRWLTLKVKVTEPLLHLLVEFLIIMLDLGLAILVGILSSIKNKHINIMSLFSPSSFMSYQFTHSLGFSHQFLCLL